MAERLCRWCTTPLPRDAPEQRIYHKSPPHYRDCGKEAQAHKVAMNLKEKAAAAAKETPEEGKARRKADKEARPRPSIAPGDTAVWTCPECGPVRGVLYGDDEDFHCSSMDCDLVVRVLTLDEVASRTPSSWSKGKDLPSEALEEDRRARLKAGKEKREADAKASKEGMEILAGMRARNAPVKEAKPVGKKKATKKVDGRSASARQGRCSECKEVKWLLRKDPPTCAACYRTENPPDHSRDAAGKRGRQKKAEAARKEKATKKAKEEKKVKKKTFKGYEWEEISQEDFCRLVDEHGMQRAAIGREVGIHGSQVGHWYRGTATPNHDHQAALRDMLADADSEKPDESEEQAPIPSTKPKRKRKKVKKKAESEPKKKRKYTRRKDKKKADDLKQNADDLAHECRAIEETSRALDGLSPQAIERVLAYTLHRYSQTNGLSAQQVIRMPTLLPAPDPGP